MADAVLCSAAAKALAGVPATRRPKVMVGFDGFIDNIIDVVAKRASYWWGDEWLLCAHGYLTKSRASY